MFDRTMDGVLDRCSDMELHCDSTIIKANAFTMITSCEIIKNLSEDFDDISVIPFPGADAHALRIAVEVIHGIANISELSLEDAELCHNGFEFLGCTVRRKKLLARLWQLISKTQDHHVFLRHAEMFMSSDYYVRNFLNTFKMLCPKWNDFQKVFDNVRLTEHIATVCMLRLCRYFPVHLVFEKLIDSFPGHCLTFDTCVKLLGSYNTGVYHHPDEVVMSINKILSKFRGEDRAVHLQTITTAFGMYDASPGSKLIATTLSFKNEPKTSVLLKIYDPYLGSRTLKVKRILTATLNTQYGTIGGFFDIEKMDEQRYYPTTVLLRITTYTNDAPWDVDVIGHSYTLTETWREYKNVEYGDPLTELESPDTWNEDDEKALTEALKNIDHLRYIRLDFFYGHGDVRQLSLF